MTPPEPVIDVQLVDHPVTPRPFDPFPQPAGAECIFLGRTRIERHEQHGPLVRLAYEAYVPMAEKVLRELAGDAVRDFDCLAVRIHHAVGIVPPGAASVVVQTVCRHREPAFEACQRLMDDLKSRAPIWKQEVWSDGTTWSSGTDVSRESIEEGA